MFLFEKGRLLPLFYTSRYIQQCLDTLVEQKLSENNSLYMLTHMAIWILQNKSVLHRIDINSNILLYLKENTGKTMHWSNFLKKGCAILGWCQNRMLEKWWQSSKTAKIGLGLLETNLGTRLSCQSVLIPSPVNQNNQKKIIKRYKRRGRERDRSPGYLERWASFEQLW